MESVKKHIFGPVPSRRLGISLGVEIVPHKTCSMNCVYCECGKTNAFTMERREYVPVSEVTEQLDERLSSGPELDYITFSGGGEPTLSSGIGKIIRHIKKGYPQYKLCLLTNGTLLGNDEVIKELKGIDLVIPSFDAVSASELETINIPCPGITVEDLIKGYVKFRSRVKCQFWLEIFIVPGVNDSDESIAAFADAVRRISPDKVQLNTLDRPGWVDWIKAAPEDIIRKFIGPIEKFAPVETVGKFKYKTRGSSLRQPAEIDEALKVLLGGRPSTIEDISFSLGIDQAAAAESLARLERTEAVSQERRERGVFFMINKRR
ncbi:MAG: hypothetical protein A2020_00270 [Lentisphaerae bacterium GWF2_45_14]|nr:MAG: hypothetical protein A2020_00270 [Lentisphaerae bacterium GWF2_45_14]